MLKPYNITWVNKLADILWLLLPVVNNLPLIKVLRAICFELLEILIRVLSSLRWSGSVLRGVVLDGDLVLQMFLRHMQVAVVFLVVEKDVVVEHHCLSIQAVLVPLLDEESHSLGWGVIYKLDQLALPVALGGPFCVLQEHLGVLVPKLDCCSIGHLLTELKLDPFFVVHVLLLDSLLQHFELVLKSYTLDGGWGVLNFSWGAASSWCCCVILHVGDLSHIHGFLFAPVFTHRIVSEFWNHLENHVSIVGHLRMMELRTLLNVNIRWIKADSG